MQLLASLIFHVSVMLILSACSQNMQTDLIESNGDQTVITPKADVPPPPSIEMLGQGARAPTAEELAQEKKFDLQQIAQAEQWLQSHDVHQRIVATEHLNAYPLPEAEQLLLITLQHDTEAVVRKSAAQSLGLFKALSDSAQNALMHAFKDKDSPTRKMALDTLLSYTTRISMDSQRFVPILSKLKQQLKSGGLPSDVKVGLQAYVNEQRPVKRSFFFNAPL